MSEYIVELTDANHNRLMAECDGIHEEIVRCRDCKWLWVYMGNSYCDCDYMERSCS